MLHGKAIVRPGWIVGGLAGVLAISAAAVAVPLAMAASAAPASHVAGISSIVITGYPLPSTPTITVEGSGFGAEPTGGTPPSQFANCDFNPAFTGLDYGKSAVWLLDGSHSAGLYGAFQEGANFSADNGNCGGVIISHWSSNKVVFGLGSDYTDAGSGVGLTSGDTVCVSIKGVPGCIKLP